LQTGNEEILGVDIRNEADFEDWHIPGSLNVDVYDELAEDTESAKEELSNLPE
jgi:rhodanese-related sulfurtransferase